MPSSCKTEETSIDVDKARKGDVKLANQDGEQEHVPLKDSKEGVVSFKIITENPGNQSEFASAWRKIFQT